MRLTLLGSFEVWDDAGQPVEIPGARLRALLVRLALDSGRAVSNDSLAEAIWGDEPALDATNALHSLVWRLRRALPREGSARLESLPVGYRLLMAADSTDIARFERLAFEGRTRRDEGDTEAAARLFSQALELWPANAPIGLTGVSFADAAVARLTELRLRTIEDLAELALAAGRTQEISADMRELIVQYPLDERLRAVYIRALCAAGRSAEALSAFEDLRQGLAQALGADPSPALRDLHTAILRGEIGGGPGPGHAGRRTNLRAVLTSFVGREHELEQLDLLLQDARLVTLVGPGGVGKTRLTAEIAVGWAKRARDGAWLVELAEIREPAKVPAAISAALGLLPADLRQGPSNDPSSADDAEQLCHSLRDREMLITLDNCEHLIEACARVADAIVGNCPGIRILATSREPLMIPGERIYQVGPLPIPDPAVSLASAVDVPSVRLFADRAAAVRFGFSLTPENLPAVIEICRRLDGLPLAIELACARLSALSATEIAARLGDRFALLSKGSRAALPRHQTLLAVVEWSWDLFSEEERTLARRLAVFADGATPEAAEAVCAEESLPTRDILGLLGALVDRSFVEFREMQGAPPRYRMLDTIRVFASAALDAAGEADRFRRTHARYFLAKAEAAEPLLRTRNQMPHFAWLRREHENLEAALRYAVDVTDTEAAVRLAAALGWYWVLLDDHAEGADWLRQILALPGADGPGDIPLDALATAYACNAMYQFGIQDPEHGMRSASRAAQLATGTDSDHPVVVLICALLPQGGGSSGLVELAGHADPWLSAVAELFLGHFLGITGDASAAVAHFAAARDKFTSLGEGWGVASAVRSLGAGHSLSGDHPAAIAALGEAIRFADALGAAEEVAWMRVERGLEYLRAGRPAEASAELAHAGAPGNALRSLSVLAFADAVLGEVKRHDGDTAQARSLLTEALRCLDQASAPPLRARILALTGLARLAIGGGQLAEARGHLVRALTLALEPQAEVQDRPAIAAVTEALAELALADSDAAEATGLLGYASAIRGAPDQGNPDVKRTEAAARLSLKDRYDAAFLPTATASADVAVGEVTAIAAALTREPGTVADGTATAATGPGKGSVGGRPRSVAC